jgi:branched-subunit amino acid aminotransferase/4-amino-4-deoxychorismate lyase
MQARASIDGVVTPLAAARIPVTDQGVARGDGGFETVGVWDGRPFRLDDHLARLAGTLAAIGLPPADLAGLRAEALALLDGWEGDGALRCYLTASGTRILTLSPPPERPPVRHLVPLPAPWIRPVGTYALAGAKTMSYLPNMAATRAATAAGGDDALLVSLEGVVLEGPTYAVLWVDGDIVRAPAVELGIVDSISRRTVLEAAGAAGLEVRTGAHPLADLARASEVLVCSSVRDVLAVARVGDLVLDGPTPVRDLLSKALTAARRGTAGQQGRVS